MKIMLLLPVFFTGMLLISCESEYNHQLSEAKTLVHQELKLRASAEVISESAPDSRYLISELQKEIAFHAHLSGNEEVFFQELKGYRQQLLSENSFGDEILLSKFP